ncbi:MAG TPA: PAS domain S-box protein [Bacteroidales bacterium]|nr:PAS domain S-box protein [Bacteroidales bacterium]
MADNHNNRQNSSSSQTINNVLIGVAISLIFPFAAWLLDMLANEDPFSFNSIVSMHHRNPDLYLIDLLPVFVGVVIYLFSVNREKEIIKFRNKIKERDERIDRNAMLAKRIGEGDYTSDIRMNGEDDVLTRSLQMMRNNLLENSKKETDQNWIAEGKDLISGILRMHNKLEDLSYNVIVSLIKYIQAVQGALYIYDDEQNKLINIATYAYNRKKYVNQEFEIGQGLIGQSAYEMDFIYRTEIPDDYATITSGILGDKKPGSLLIVPLITDEKLQGVVEFASLEDEIPELTIKFLRELGEIIARTLFNLRINEKTEKLLQESQQMTEELQENEEQLRLNAEEMRATQEELQKSNEKLEAQVLAVENAQKRLHSLLENASEIISIYDENMKLIYESPSVTSILGYTPEEMVNGKDMDRLTRKGEAEVRQMFRELLAHPEQAITIQYTYMKKDGEKIFLETTGRNLLDDKAINGIILNSQDITERKRAEKEERMRSKMQSLSENSLDMIIRLSTTGQFFYANPVVEDYIGKQNKDIINKTYKDIKLHEELHKYFESTIKEIKTKPHKTNKELTLPQKLGEKEINRIMSLDAIPEFNDGELETILFVGHDITEAKRIELEIQEKNRKIGDSINYAERIQTSILPDNKLIREVLPKSFIFYKPRDVVSGDFPWFFQKEEYIYIAAVDCTGHGVPGALLSFIGYFILNNVVDHDKNYTAAEICNQLHAGVRSTLKQDRDDANARDGMDIALCKINLKKKEVQYAGAHRPLYLMRKGELNEFKGDRKAIGGIPLGKKPEKDFTNHVINMLKGDKIFFFSDGLPDQLGGPELKKYSPRRIRESITGNPSFSMQEYYNYFAEDFDNWKGNHKQIDDVLLIGIEF